MISLTPNIRNFTAKLFAEKTFDNFLLAEANFATDYIVSVDGTAQRPAGEEAAEGSAAGTGPAAGNAENYIRWEIFRPVAMQLVKGSRLPQAFHIVLMLSRRKLAEFIAASRCDIDPEDVGNLCINIRYQEEKLTVTTGCALKIFTMDRTLEKAWDRQIEGFLEKI